MNINVRIGTCLSKCSHAAHKFFVLPPGIHLPGRPAAGRQFLLSLFEMIATGFKVRLGELDLVWTIDDLRLGTRCENANAHG